MNVRSASPWLAAGLILTILAAPLRAPCAEGVEKQSPAAPKDAAGGGQESLGEPIPPVGGDLWKKLSPQDREKLREIYRRLSALPPLQRDRLLQRLRTMKPEETRQVIERAREQLRRLRAGAPLDAGRKGEPKAGERGPPAEKKRLRAGGPPAAPGPKGLQERPLSPERARAIERSFRRWSERLPPDVRERLRFFTRKEQLEFFRSSWESEMLLRTFPERGEKAALLALPPARLRSLAGQGAERPEGISAESWKRWLDLRPGERGIALRRLARLREEAVSSGSSGGETFGPERPEKRSSKEPPASTAPEGDQK